VPPCHAPPLSWAAWRWALPHPPQALYPPPPPRLMVRGGGSSSHLSGRACPPSLFSSSSDDEYSEVAGEESPCCSCSRNSSLFCSRHSRRRILFSFLRVARSCYRRCARELGLGVWAGRTVRHGWSPAAGNERKIRPRRCVPGKWRETR
jgi:hypothetical protein